MSAVIFGLKDTLKVVR